MQIKSTTAEFLSGFFSATLTTCVAFAATTAEPAKTEAPATTRIASDLATKKIRRSIANENLKSISTKDAAAATTTDVPAEPSPDSVAGAVADAGHEATHETEHEKAPAALDHGADVHEVTEAQPVAAPQAKVETAAAPGTREPAASEKEKAEDKAAHAAANEGVAADTALGWLKNGNKRFVTKALRNDGKSRKDRERLAKGQHPHAIILSCSDSRVPPETVFDQALGEIFTVRTAGEAVDSSVLASIEYAVEHLGPKLLVVMGHTSCGAVKASIETAEGKSAGSESLDKLIGDIRPRLPTRAPAAAPSAGLEVESTANARGVAADLVKRSAIIRARVERGELKIVPSLYNLETGAVKFD